MNRRMLVGSVCYSLSLLLFLFANQTLAECMADSSATVLMPGTSAGLAWECLDPHQSGLPDGIKLAPGGTAVIPAPNQPGLCYFVTASNAPLPTGATGYWLPNPNINVVSAGQQSSTLKDWLSFKADTSLSGTLNWVVQACSTPTCGTAHNQIFTDAASLNTAGSAPGGWCNGAVFSGLSGSGPWTWSCTPAVGPASSCKANLGCPVTNVTWTVGTNNCSGQAPAAVVGTQSSVTDAAGNKAYFTCSAAGTYNATTADPAPVATCAGTSGVCNPSIDQINPYSTLADLNTAAGGVLCTSGTATIALPFTGSGPWTWTCNGSGGGSNTSCTASIVGTPGICGPLNGQLETQGTVVNSSLSCYAGTSTPFVGSGTIPFTWTWTCGGQTCMTGCGTTAGPIENCQCIFGQSSDGSPVYIQTDTQMTQACCNARNIVAQASGAGNANGCIWGGPVTGTQTASPFQAPVAINATCGSADAQATLDPTILGLCPTNITVSGYQWTGANWTWTCKGVNGGLDKACSANLPAGACAPANTMSWMPGCSYSPFPAMANGTSAFYSSNNGGNKSGDATYKCVNGVYQITGANCN